jgi:uncharacterized phage protein gp47/JayE
MASINSQSFTVLVTNMVTAIQANASIALNLTVGSVLRAIVEAVAGMGLWLQAQIAYVLTITRAATSNGPDLDSFVNDFGLTRLAAVAAVGQLTFSRFSTVGSAVVLPNASVQSADGTQNFLVTIDTTNAAWNPAAGGYLMNPGTGSVTVPAQAVTPGAAGNVLANTVTVITQPISGVDTVTNASAFVNGLDAEADSALRTRFVLFINSLSKAIKSAIQFAVASVQQGIALTLTENLAYNGTYQPGYFYAVIDDGTGTPPTSLINAVGAAIEAVRGFTIQYGVFGPLVLTANVNMEIDAASGYDPTAVAANVSLAITNFINGLGLGNSLPYTQLAAIAYGVAGVVNVTDVTLNSAVADLDADNKHVIHAGAITVSGT